MQLVECTTFGCRLVQVVGIGRPPYWNPHAVDALDGNRGRERRPVREAAAQTHRNLPGCGGMSGLSPLGLLSDSRDDACDDCADTLFEGTGQADLVDVLERFGKRHRVHFAIAGEGDGGNSGP